jgi:TolA-binding protein
VSEELPDGNQHKDILELRGVDDPDEATIHDIWLCGKPFGQMWQAQQERIDRLEDRVEELEQGGEGRDDMGARKEMIDIHVVLQDLKHGRDNHPKADIRAARLLQPFIREIGERGALTGIERSHGKLKLKSNHARRILQEHNLGTNSGMTVTVGRAMDAAVRGSEYGDDDRPLFHHASDSSHVLSVDKDAWLGYLDEIAAALDADVTVPQQLADDPETGEDAAEADEELAALEAAEPERTNTVVSTNNEGVLGGGSDD